MVSDERLKWLDKYGYTIDLNQGEFDSICTELLARRRECEAARALRDFWDHSSSEELDAYDAARAATDAIGGKP